MLDRCAVGSQKLEVRDQGLGIRELEVGSWSAALLELGSWTAAMLEVGSGESACKKYDAAKGV